MAQEPFIICDNLVKIYKIANLETVALQGLDLIVARGEMMGIIGPSGSGKSTLMNILGGLVRPSAGRVWVDGIDLLKMSDAGLNRYRRSKVGFVWQQGTRNLVPYLTALENVELPMILAGKSGREDRRYAESLLDSVGLAERRHHHLAQMSGGEQQRVAIAVALSNNPTLLLGDEPTGEVDSATALTIYQTIQRLNQEFGLTTLIVSHDPGIARHVSRVVAVRDGKLAAETVRQSALNGDSAQNGFSEDQEEEVYEELVVLDSVGRLQISREYLDYFGIKGRVRLELTEDGILIRPATLSAEMQHTAANVADLLPQKGMAENPLGKLQADLRKALSSSKARGWLDGIRSRRQKTRHGRES